MLYNRKVQGSIETSLDRHFSAMVPRVLFICTGNTCRSPMAEGFLRHLASEENVELETASAGLGAMENMPPSRNSVIAMAGTRDRYLASAQPDADSRDGRGVYSHFWNGPRTRPDDSGPLSRSSGEDFCPPGIHCRRWQHGSQCLGSDWRKSLRIQGSAKPHRGGDPVHPAVRPDWRPGTAQRFLASQKRKEIPVRATSTTARLTIIVRRQ